MGIMKAVVYSRVSTEEQNPESQLQDIIDYASSRGYTIVKVFEENISGATYPFERPVFNQVLRFIREHDVDLLLLHDITRFYRPPPGSAFKALGIMRRIMDEYNILIEFVSEPEIEDPMLSELWRFLKSWISAYERLQISMRTKYGLLRIKREGRLYHKPDIVYYYASWLYDKDPGDVTREEYMAALKQLRNLVMKYWNDPSLKKTRISEVLKRNELKGLYTRFPRAPKSYLTFYRLVHSDDGKIKGGG